MDIFGVAPFRDVNPFEFAFLGGPLPSWTCTFKATQGSGFGKNLPVLLSAFDSYQIYIYIPYHPWIPVFTKKKGKIQRKETWML